MLQEFLKHDGQGLFSHWKNDSWCYLAPEFRWICLRTVFFSRGFRPWVLGSLGWIQNLCVGGIPSFGIRAFQSEILRRKKTQQPFPLVLKVFARYLTDTLCFKRFEGNWLCLLPGYLGCFHVREGEIIYWVSWITTAVMKKKVKWLSRPGWWRKSFQSHLPCIVTPWKKWGLWLPL